MKTNNEMKRFNMYMCVCVWRYDKSLESDIIFKKKTLRQCMRQGKRMHM